jgi:hypothetical protein
VSGQLALKARRRRHPLVDRPLPIRRGFFLIDFSAGGEQAAERLFRGAPGYLADGSQRGDIRWRVACASNGDGFLVPLTDRLLSAVRTGTVDRAFWSQLDRAEPLAFGLGLELNLFWTYDGRTFDLMLRDAFLPRLTQETELLRASTYFPSTEFFEQLAVHGGLDRERTEAFLAGVRRHLVRSPRDYPRVLIHEPPCIDLRDTALEQALLLAGRALDFSRAFEEWNVPGHRLLLNRFIREVRDHHHEYTVNDIVPLQHRIEEQTQEYSRLNQNLGRLSDTLRNSIREIGTELDRIYQRAVREAVWHHDHRVAAGLAKTILAAQQLVVLPALERKLSAGDLPPAMIRVLRGEQAADGDDPVERFLATIGDVAEWLSDTRDVTDAITEWVELITARAALRARGGGDARQVRNVVRLVYAVEARRQRGQPDPVEIPDEVEVEFFLREVEVRYPGESVTRRRTVRLLRLAGGRRALAGAGRVLDTVNLAMALEDITTEDGFRRAAALVEATEGAVQLASEVRAITTWLAREQLDLPLAPLERIAGVAGLAVTVLDIAEASGEGNNVAAIGHAIAGVGGVAAVLAEGGGVGVAAAVLVITGAVVVELSLDDRERFVREYAEQVAPTAQHVVNEAHREARRAARLVSSARRLIDEQSLETRS